MEASHRGSPCIYPEGPSTCQEGKCSNCMIHKKHQENQDDLSGRRIEMLDM